MKKVVKMTVTKYMHVTKEEDVNVFTCDECGKKLSRDHNWPIVYNNEESQWLCSICGKGHWCRDHFFIVTLKKPMPGNDWRKDYMQICPQCKLDHVNIITDLLSVWDQKDKLEDVESDVLEKLEALRRG